MIRTTQDISVKSLETYDRATQEGSDEKPRSLKLGSTPAARGWNFAFLPDNGSLWVTFGRSSDAFAKSTLSSNRLPPPPDHESEAEQSTPRWYEVFDDTPQAASQYAPEAGQTTMTGDELNDVLDDVLEQRKRELAGQ